MQLHRFCTGSVSVPRPLPRPLHIARAQTGVTTTHTQASPGVEQEFAGNYEQQQTARRTAYRIRLRDLVQPASAATDKGGELHVKFHVRYKTDFGQTVCLVGNVDALGKWQVDHAVQLAWSDGHLWQGSIPIPEGTRMEYKYVIKDEAGRVVRWQEGDNVVLELPPSARSIALEVEDAWNHEKQVKRILAAGTPVKFNLQKQCAWGQQVVVVGGHATLGNWDVSKGLKLKWTEGHVWEASLELPSGDTIQYKYVLVSEDGSVEWQEGDNLSMEVPAVAPTVNGRRRGVLVLDSWLRQAPRAPRPSAQPQLEANAASEAAAADGSAGEAPAAPVDPIHLHQQAPRFGGREGSSSSEQASNSGRGGNYDALMERLQAIMASQTTPPPRPRGGKQPSSSSAAPASQQQQQQQPQVPPLPEPVLSLWTEGPRFAGQAATEGVAQWSGGVGGPSAALQPPAGVDLADPVELGRWQALNSVMLALQHSSELSHWCDDPTDPRMLAADRRLAALTASLGGSSSFVGVSV